MTLEASRVPEPGFGSLQSCLVEGDLQSEKRARRIKRRAVAISIALQTLALTALVLFPLLGRGERISPPDFTPIPPYAPVGRPHHSAPPDSERRAPVQCRFCAPRNISPTIITHDPSRGAASDNPDGDVIPGLPSGPGVPGGFNPSAQRQAAPPPPDTQEPPTRYQRSEFLQMAQLLNRVEPAYPPLAIQTRREGRVELHAIIATDGTIQSLEVVSGDPFFIQSALSAVRQWRYRPTILNGRPVEIDTRITVIYTLSH